MSSYGISYAKAYKRIKLIMVKTHNSSKRLVVATHKTTNRGNRMKALKEKRRNNPIIDKIK